MFKGTGKKTSELRELPPFTKIYLQDNVNVFIRQGSVQEVKVEGGEKLIPLVKMKVDTGVLFISDDNKCNWARSYKKGVLNVYLTMPELRFIWHYGSGNITGIDTIFCDTLNIQTRESGDVDLTLNSGIIYNQLHGSSDVTIRGKSPLMGVYHRGEGYLHAEEMYTDEIWTYSEASGNEYLNVKNSIGAKIEWEGNIFYRGSPPNINASIKGNGKLIPIN